MDKTFSMLIGDDAFVDRRLAEDCMLLILVGI